MTENAETIALIEDRVRQVWQRFAEQDPKGMLDLLHPECTVWDIFQPDLVSREEMEAYVEKDYEQSAARGALTYSMSPMTTSVWGDAAICRFLLSFTYEAPSPAEGTGRITCVLRQFPDDGWLLVHVHEGHVPEGIPHITNN